jgi:AcrB/AcrD/AcrF family
MVANFQSWREPLIIMMAVPGALAGVLWMLVLTGTTINVESMMGAIMAVGVGVANGNLLIVFANDLREEGRDAVAAAIEAGATRLRPIMMTALAMVLGMLPMALAIGEGSEQNAPLGRAVIGGLLFARRRAGRVPARPAIGDQTSIRERPRTSQSARWFENRMPKTACFRLVAEQRPHNRNRLYR